MRLTGRFGALDHPPNGGTVFVLLGVLGSIPNLKKQRDLSSLEKVACECGAGGPWRSHTDNLDLPIGLIQHVARTLNRIRRIFSAHLEPSFQVLISIRRGREVPDRGFMLVRIRILVHDVPIRRATDSNESP